MPDLLYFNEEEFRKAQPSCSLSDMDPSFMVKVDLARDRAGVPFHVNSAYRSEEYEISKGRAGTSQHCKGKALDIACYTNDFRFRIISALIEVGFRRIGIGKNFIHVDDGYPNAVNPIIWLY